MCFVHLNFIVLRLLRLDLNGNQCQLVFYEKSKIKCLIFLVLELHQTKQEEIINEMSENILQLKVVYVHKNKYRNI